MVRIIKMNGEPDTYSREKVIRSCMRAGASTAVCNRIADEVEASLFDGIETRKILDMIHMKLKETDKFSADRYKLKDAISKLDPEFHEFEFFVARLLQYEGFETKRSPEPKIQGFCVDHEIDVVASKKNIVAIIECKHHFRDHTFTGLDVPMRQWARLEDVAHGYKNGARNSINATSAWVVTNTKYSEHAVRYSKCRGIRLIGWNFPHDLGLNNMIESCGAYPLTLAGLTRNEREKLVYNGIFNVLDFLNADENKLRRCGFEDFRSRGLKKKIQSLVDSGLRNRVCD